MPKNEGMSLVLDAITQLKGGEIFILKMPVFRLGDLIEIVKEKVGPLHGLKPGQIKEERIGPRPGEKLYEDLMTEEESKNAIETADKFIIMPRLGPVSQRVMPRPAKARRYSSADIKPLSKDELRKLILPKCPRF